MKRLFTVLLAFVAFSAHGASSPMKAFDLKCEYLKSPICIDMPDPRFSWLLEDSRRNAKQTAYRVLVATDSAALVSGKADMWDSGKQTARNNNGIKYTGKGFSPRTKYYWVVQVWDSEGLPSALSPAASFETAMWRTSQWRGYWIDNKQSKEHKPAPYFRKEADLGGKPIARARAYISGVGYYVFSINGKRVGDELLAPGYTKYDKKVFYQTYDVTDMLNEGRNAFGVILGNGWFNEQAKGVWHFHEAPWRDTPKFILNLYVTYEDGTEDVIVSDGTWKFSEGPLRYNNIYAGEKYDARMEMPGWDKPGFDDSSWKNASRDAVMIYDFSSTGELRAQTMQPIRAKAELKPQSINKISDTVCVFDMGVNLAGLTKIKIRGERGTKLRIIHGERLYDNGRVDMRDIAVHMRFDDGETFQCSEYILKGGETEEWMPEFTYYGFQYVEVASDRPVQLDESSITAYQVHTDIEKTGTFECSDDLVNKILEIGLRSYVSNLHGIFTDCPHREKNGWTGDAHIACEVGMYNFDAILPYEKYVWDLREAQGASGIFPGIVPTSGWGYHWANGPSYDAVNFLIPWYVYLYYGDDSLIKSGYDHCRRYMEYLAMEAEDHIVPLGLDDWAHIKTPTSPKMISTLYYYKHAELMSLYATIMDKPDEAEEYRRLAADIGNAINTRLFDPAAGIYDKGSQAAQSGALYMGVVEPEHRQIVADNLVKAVHAEKDHLDVGLFGSKFLLNALTSTGNNALAYKVASQPTFPSWGHWVMQGFTTMHEFWKSTDSRNHIMFGEICAWMYKALAGINPDPSDPGYRHINIRPGADTGLTYAKATTRTPNGDVTCNWEKTGRRGEVLSVNVIVPVNSTATLRIPADEKKNIYLDGERLREDYSTLTFVREGGEIVVGIGSGNYSFEVK